MGQIICITNLKGGSGKTTTAINLSASLAVAEKKTLLIDCDPQANATLGLGIDKKSILYPFSHAILQGKIQKQHIINTELEYLKIIPSRIDLLKAEIKLSSKKNKEFLIRNLLDGIKDEYDYIIIDTSPSMGILTVSALVAANSFLVPMPCEFYALEGFGHILKAVKLIKKTFNPELKMAGTLLTMYNEDEEFSKKIAQLIKARLKHMVFQTIVPYEKKIKESPCYGRSILSLEVDSSAASHYLSLATEIINDKTN